MKPRLKEDLNIQYLETTKSGIKYFSVRASNNADFGVIKFDTRAKLGDYYPTPECRLSADRLQELFAFIKWLK